MVDLRIVVNEAAEPEVIEMIRKQLRDTDVILVEGSEIQVVLAATNPTATIEVVVPRLRSSLPVPCAFVVDGRAVA